MDFYDDVLRELITAVGAALFVANLFALIKRGADRRRAAQRAPAKRRPGSPARREAGAPRDRETLTQAPLARTVVYMLIGFIVMVAGIAAIATK